MLWLINVHQTLLEVTIFMLNQPSLKLQLRLGLGFSWGVVVLDQTKLVRSSFLHINNLRIFYSLGLIKPITQQDLFKGFSAHYEALIRYLDLSYTKVLKG